MNTREKISVQKAPHTRYQPKTDELGFGKFFTDHMFLLDYDCEQGWHHPRITPYGPLLMDPGASVIHYGQSLFEGMKAFRSKEGKILLFRPQFNCERLQTGAERLCMPPPPTDLIMEGLTTLIAMDRDWVPEKRGCALYIRPTLVGIEPFLGVRPAHNYLFYIILSPVGSYYKEGVNPVKIYVEEKFTRAAPGGLGAIKASANYAASLFASELAKAKGFSQVLWLDALEHKYIEEVGTMNVFFRIRDVVITPPLKGTILNGGVRDSVIKLLKSWKVPIVERPITIAEVLEAYQKKELQEAFGTGTAAVISPVGELSYQGQTLKINNFEIGEMAMKLYNEITAIQYGDKKDPFGWITEL